MFSQKAKSSFSSENGIRKEAKRIERGKKAKRGKRKEEI
jgi:hypothetical protein